MQFQNNSITAQFVGKGRKPSKGTREDGRESILFDQQREQEADKKREEDTSDREQVDEGRDAKGNNCLVSKKKSRKSSGTNCCHEDILIHCRNFKN